eukprot:scaffold4207_cov63-Phaeocystis_antarctica.AAC.1
MASTIPATEVSSLAPSARTADMKHASSITTVVIPGLRHICGELPARLFPAQCMVRWYGARSGKGGFTRDERLRRVQEATVWGAGPLTVRRGLLGAAGVPVQGSARASCSVAALCVSRRQNCPATKTALQLHCGHGGALAQNVAIVSAGEESDRAAEGMAKEATAACGYGVKVIPKRAPITVD